MFWHRYLQRFYSLFLISLVLLITSCNVFPPADTPSSTPTNGTAIPTSAPQKPLKVEVQFVVTIPQGTPSGDIYLDVLDEVTGLSLNPLRYPMKKDDDTHYQVHLSFPMGSLVKYRYSHAGTPLALETTSTGLQVHYRALYAVSPTVVSDIISGWSDLVYQGSTGRIEGKITDFNGIPLTNIMVCSGGQQTLTSSSGSFLMDKLPAGTHNLTAFSLDGAYKTFQQGALIAANSITPVTITMIPANRVDITFTVSIPKSEIHGVPVRFIGNLYSLGLTYAELSGGTSTLASRSPLMTYLSDEQYSFTINLPAGYDLRYKYSLGDGFWNSEHDKQGNFVIRQMIVPDTTMVVSDAVESWGQNDAQVVNYSLVVPPETPATDIISLQFNPYTWTPSLPMWPLGNNQWFYILYPPLKISNTISYRYCRNDQCGVADDISTIGNAATGYPFKLKSDKQSFSDQIKTWAWFSANQSPAEMVELEIKPKGVNFFTGVELSPNYNPSWQSYLGPALQNIHEYGATWSILSPTWSYTSINPPILEQSPGTDPLWMDMVQMSAWSQQRGLNVAIFPQTNMDSQWWINASKDPLWWDRWFAAYREFLLHNADLATQSNAKALIIGEPHSMPSFLNVTLPDGSISNAPSISSDKWIALIGEVRAHFSGSLIFALEYPSEVQNPPPFIDEFNEAYILFSSALSENPAATIEELNYSIGAKLDEDVLPLVQNHNLSVILGIKYPSNEYALQGCIPSANNCVNFSIVDQPFTNAINTPVDLTIQSNIYQAFLRAVNDRSWIGGVTSRGFYPVASLQDASSSIYGKPSSTILWYWFPKMLQNP